MNKRLRILMLCLCGAVGIAIAVGLARRAKSAKPLQSTNPSSVTATPVSNTSTQAKAEPAAEPAPPAAEPPAFPSTEADEESGLVTRRFQQMERTLEDIREENARAQRNLRATLEEVHDKVQRPPAVAVAQPAPPATLPEDPAEGKTEDLPKPATPVQEEGDGKLTVDWNNTDILSAIKVLNDQGLNILASKSVSGTVTASLSNVDAETALRAILKNAGYVARREKGIIYVGTAADFASMDQSQDTAAMRVYRPNYVKAADLEKLITPLITPTFGKVTVSAAAQVDIPSDQVKTGANDFAGGDVVVVKDYENVLRQIDELYDEVDVKPAQVAIEAMIINVKLNDSNQFGVNFQALRDHANARVVTGNSPLASLATLDVGNGGLKFGFLDSSLSTFIVALEQVGDTNVVASPRVLCMNKQRAEIQIGEQLGYVNTTVTQTFSTQSVSFLDVGTLLRIRPFIGNDGFIRMEVHPELSTGSVTISDGLTLPNKSVTQVTSNVGCYDGNTIVIGGLLRDDKQTTTNQVPFLGNLPWVGPAFRTKTEKIIKDEIIVVITPRIVSEDALCAEGERMANEFTHKQDVYFDKMSPIAKRNYALRYQRLALAAFNAGDYPRAIKQIDWSIHFDPMNRDAINLRNEIVVAGGYEGESVHEYLNHARAPWHRPHMDYSKYGAPWKPAPAFGDQIRVKELPDPGVPGEKKTISLLPEEKKS
jgi:type IV pilus assembly protein PilQ